MKKKFFIIGIITIVIAAGILLTSKISASSPVKPPAGNEGIIIVRVFEAMYALPASIITVYEDGKTEKVDLGKINAKSMDMTVLTIHTKLNEIMNKGYDLAFTTGGNSDNVICTTFIFKKKG